MREVDREIHKLGEEYPTRVYQSDQTKRRSKVPSLPVPWM